MGAIAIPDPTKLLLQGGRNIATTVGYFYFESDNDTLNSAEANIDSGYQRSDMYVSKADIDILGNGETVTRYTFNNGCTYRYGKSGNGDSMYIGFYDSSNNGLYSTGYNLNIFESIDVVLSSEYNKIATVRKLTSNNKFVYTSAGSLSEGAFATLTANNEVPEDPYFNAEESFPDGGYGDFDYSGDPVDIPDLPSISVADSGFVTLFNPSISQLHDLASYMWTGLFDLANFRKIFADPMDCILSLSIVPVSPPTTSAAELKVGNIGTGINIYKLSQQFVKVEFASRNIGLRTNGFMDFSPYTKCEIFLPYIGVHSLSIDDIAGANIKIEYHIDLFSGACTAYIKCSKNNSDGSPINSVLYQFTGNILCNIPITATNFSSFLQSVIGAAAATAVGVATGGAGITAAGAVSAVNSTMSMKPEIERSGNLSSASGFLGIQKPYLIITYPNLCRPGGRDKTVGTPSFLGLSTNKKLKMFHGFTRLHKINITGLPCTELEKNMIASELMEGVILP